MQNPIPLIVETNYLFHRGKRCSRLEGTNFRSIFSSLTLRKEGIVAALCLKATTEVPSLHRRFCHHLYTGLLLTLKQPLGFSWLLSWSKKLPKRARQSKYSPKIRWVTRLLSCYLWRCQAFLSFWKNHLYKYLSPQSQHIYQSFRHNHPVTYIQLNKHVIGETLQCN